MNLLNFIGTMLVITNLILLTLGACTIWMMLKLTKIIESQKLQPVKQERKHTPVAKASFSNALNPYDQFKDKKSNLYVPRRPKGGVELKPMEDEE